MADNNECFPLAAVMRPEPGALLGINVPYPFPASSTQLGVFGSPWLGADRLRMASSYWSNAIFPYVGDKDCYSIPGLREYVVPGDNPLLGPTYNDTFYMNGDLHRYPLSNVSNQGTVPLFWTGQGRLSLRGRTRAVPSLDCRSTIDDCMFNPTGQASGERLYQDTGRADTVAQVVTSSPTFWIFDGKQMPMATVDTSAALVPVGNVIYPNVSNPGTAIAFPFSQLDTDGSLGPDPFNASGTRSQYWTCNVNGVVTTAPSNSNMTYWCFFRPDRTLGLRRSARP